MWTRHTRSQTKKRTHQKKKGRVSFEVCLPFERRVTKGPVTHQNDLETTIYPVERLRSLKDINLTKIKRFWCFRLLWEDRCVVVNLGLRIGKSRISTDFINSSRSHGNYKTENNKDNIKYLWICKGKENPNRVKKTVM